MNISLNKAATRYLSILAIGVSTSSLWGQTFTGQNLGTPTLSGSAVVNGTNSVTLKGGGADIYGAADGGYYYYTSFSGPVWEAKVKVSSFTGPDTWSKVGLMVRRPTAPGDAPSAGDPEIMVVTTRATPGQNDVGTQHRAIRDGTTYDHQNLGPEGAKIPPTFPNQWLRVVRYNNVFTTYYGTDGTNWTAFSAFSAFDTGSTANNFDGTPWENPIQIGVAITADSDADTNGAVAVVTNLSVTVPVPPGIVGERSPIRGTTNVYAYTEANFSYAATNNAKPGDIYGMSYVWFKNGTAVSTNSGTNFTFLTTPADNGASIYCVAHVADPLYFSLSVTSAVLNLTANSGALVYTNGLKREILVGATRTGAERGDTVRGVVDMITEAQWPGGLPANTTARYSGYFIPQTNSSYVFFVAADDDTDLYLSTDSNPANKRLIAQETVFSPALGWSSGVNSNPAQKRSDQWVPDPLNPVAPPYASGIQLTGGQLYYIEAVHHNGAGGDNFAVTYQTVNEIADPSWPLIFVDGTASRLASTNNNIALVTWPGTNITWTTQPFSTAVFEGDTAIFKAVATSDSEMTLKYQWYVNGAPSASGTSSNLSLPFVSTALNGAQIQVVASTREGGLSITSSVVNLTVNQAVLEPGYVKVERWDNTTRAQVENGSVAAPGYVMAVPAMEVSVDNPGGQNNFSRRISGFFIPTNTDNYVFFINGDDDTDLFIGTNNDPATKRLVCQELVWSNARNWLTANGNAATVGQKRSDQWTLNNAGGLPPYIDGIHLNANQRYYMEAVFHQGGGGANVEATFKSTSDGDPANGTFSRFKGDLIAMNAPRSTYVAFTKQPTNVTVQPMQSAVFSVAGTTDSTIAVGSINGNEPTQTNNFLAYQWQKNGVDIPGAISATLTYGPVIPSENGAQITCRIRSLGYTDNSLNRIWSNSVPATITVSPQAVYEPGLVKVEWWTNGTRAAIENGTAGNPSYVYTSPKWMAPSTSPYDNYGNRVSGFFVPPTTGDYVFFMGTDDDGDLFLSTDSSPVNKRLIARETSWDGGFLQWNTAGGQTARRRSDQFVDPATGLQLNAAGIHLNAGQQYYMEGVHHEGGGGDHFEVSYKLIADPDPVNGDDVKTVGNVIGFYATRIPWVAFLQQPQSQQVTAGDTAVTFSVQGTNAPSIVVGGTGSPQSWFLNPTDRYLMYQWYKDGTPIAGATSSSYTRYPVLSADNNAQFVCAIRAVGYADDLLNPIYSNSVPAVLTVAPDVAPPTITYAVAFQNTNQVPPQFVVNVTFNEWMDRSTLSNAANYSIAGVTITNVSVAANNRTVQLLVDQMPTLPLNVVVSGVKDLTGNTIAASSPKAITSEKLTFTDIGTPTLDPTYPSAAWVTGTGGYIVSAQGSDIWGAADAFNFAWESKTNDFDVVVRHISETSTRANAKGGLMVRETLDANSRNWSIVNDPLPPGSNAVEANMRTNAGVASVAWDAGGRPAPAYPNAWLRIKRTGTVLTGYVSTNGVSWVQRATYNTTNVAPGGLTNIVYVGISTSGNGNDPYTIPPPATFSFYNTSIYDSYTSSYVASALPAQMSVSQSGSNLIISWTPVGGHLEASPALGATANWQTVTTTNPATVPIGPNAQFFRIVNP